jgi:hypothetical protein
VTIDLKWGMFLYVPIALIFTARVCAFLAGVHYSPNIAYGVFSTSLVLGFAIGAAISAFMASEGIKWNISIGGNR